MEEDDGAYYFYGASGSVYRCGKESYGLRLNNSYVWTQLQKLYEEKVVMMGASTDWMNVDWSIK